MDATHPAKTPSTIRGFDGIRGLAALTVVLGHAGFYNHVLHSRAFPLFDGRAGVTWFLVLSGFLITSLLIREHRATSRINLKYFYIRRFLRIFPPFYLSLAITAVLVGVGLAHASGRAFGLAAIYVYNFVPVSMNYPILEHTWSLAVEEHFYFIWPLLFSLLYRRGNWLFLPLGLSIVLAYPFLRSILGSFPGIGMRFHLWNWSMIAGSAVAWGCMAALLVSRRKVLDFLRRRLNILLLVGLVMYVAPLAVGFLPWATPAFVQMGGTACLLTWIFLRQNSAAVSVLELKPLRYLGRVSYGIYLFQGMLLTTGAARKGESWPLPTGYALILLACIVPLSFRFFETPILRLKDRFHMRPAPVKAP